MNRWKVLSVWVLGFCEVACLATPAKAQDASLPKMEAREIRTVFRNHEHNASTDLARFQGRYYLAFRSCPDGHMVHPTSSIRILSSVDLQHWDEVHRFSVPLRDTRDPHFLVFQEKLFVYTGTWYSGKTTLPRDQYELNQHLGYAAWTGNGTDWNSPILLEGTFGHYIWRATAHDGKAYLCGRRKHAFQVGPRGETSIVESAMLESDDGLTWHTRALFQETDGDETAFQMDADGSILAIGRRGNQMAQLIRSRPPYTSWDRKDLNRYVGGPLLVRWNDRWLVGGRKMIDRNHPTTCLYWLDSDQLVEALELPSGGDNSYPGFLQLSPTEAVVSWYSSHEKDENGKSVTAIYMANLVIDHP